MQKQMPLNPGNYYHVYNHGVNGEAVFKEEKNYVKFLELYENHVHPVVDTLAYNLLGNHFHLVIKPREFCRPGYDIYNLFGSNAIEANRISKQFSHLFNGYAQSFNKIYERTGALFETTFRSKVVDNPGYLNQLIHYVHANPQMHGLISDFRQWPYSSYGAYAKRVKTNIIQSDYAYSMPDISAQREFPNNMDLNNIRAFILDMEELTL
jgi:REP element-mobilizing transposase RayT